MLLDTSLTSHRTQANQNLLPPLLTLLHYATTHKHSRQWVGAILTILAQKGVAHG